MPLLPSNLSVSKVFPPQMPGCYSLPPQNLGVPFGYNFTVIRRVRWKKVKDISVHLNRINFESSKSHFSWAAWSWRMYQPGLPAVAVRKRDASCPIMVRLESWIFTIDLYVPLGQSVYVLDYIISVGQARLLGSSHFVSCGIQVDPFQGCFTVLHGKYWKLFSRVRVPWGWEQYFIHLFVFSIYLVACFRWVVYSNSSIDVNWMNEWKALGLCYICLW